MVCHYLMGIWYVCIMIFLVYSQIFTVDDPAEAWTLVGNLLQNLYAIWDGVGSRRHDGGRKIRRIGGAREMFQNARMAARLQSNGFRL